MNLLGLGTCLLLTLKVWHLWYLVAGQLKWLLVLLVQIHQCLQFHGSGHVCDLFKFCTSYQKVSSSNILPESLCWLLKREPLTMSSLVLCFDYILSFLIATDTFHSISGLAKMSNIVQYSYEQIPIPLPLLHHFSWAHWDFHGSGLAAVISHLMDYLDWLASMSLWPVSQ